jgi:hypothetical protein
MLNFRKHETKEDRDQRKLEKKLAYLRKEAERSRTFSEKRWLKKHSEEERVAIEQEYLRKCYELLDRYEVRIREEKEAEEKTAEEKAAE